MKMTKHNVTIALVALVVGFGGGYYIGHGTAPANTTTNPSGFTRGASGMRGGGGGGFLSGTVAKQDSGSITIDTRDGSSHVVLLTPATTVAKSAVGSLSDISVGANIIVIGTTNGDGSISANQIQLRPAGAPATMGR